MSDLYWKQKAAHINQLNSGTALSVSSRCAAETNQLTLTRHIPVSLKLTRAAPTDSSKIFSVVSETSFPPPQVVFFFDKSWMIGQTEKYISLFAKGNRSLKIQLIQTILKKQQQKTLVGVTIFSHTWDIYRRWTKTGWHNGGKKSLLDLSFELKILWPII